MPKIHVGLFSRRISIQRSTIVYHVSGLCCKGFQDQRLKVGSHDRTKCYSGRGINFNDVASRLTYYEGSLTMYVTDKQKQDAQLSQRDRAAGCVIVFAESRRLEELGDNILVNVCSLQWSIA